jgi:Lysine methyltransferase
MPPASHNDDNESDDSSAEGQLHRNLFHTDDDSDSSDGAINNTLSDNIPDESIDDSMAPGSMDRIETAYCSRRVLHVTIEEQTSGGSIAQQLWPAAEHLALYITRVADNVSTNDNAGLAERDIDDMSVPIADKTQAINRDSVCKETLQTLKQALESCNNTENSLGPPILELGAGIGLTGIELATQLVCPVLLTDLPAAMPLLQTNRDLNQHLYKMGPDAVSLDVCEWGKTSDIGRCIDWLEKKSATNSSPWVVIGADVVYWESLYVPLEQTLFGILSVAPPGSFAVLAGMRRWKRDTAFYQTLGHRTRTAAHELVCQCVDEQVRRVDNERHIMRIYVVEWKARVNKKKQSKA